MPTINNLPAPTPRKLFVGPFQPALESALADEIAAFKKQHGPLAPLLVVALSHLLALHLQRTLAHRLGGHANIHFTTLADLAAESAPPAPACRAPQLGLELLATQIARDAIPADGYFQPVRDTKGFANALLATFTDLKEAGITPAAFKSSAKSPKLRELADAYAEFSQWLTNHNWLTEADLFTNPKPRTPSFRT